ncbi:system protein b [Diplodia corticola]|uniref:System protein b n=1 Tax=Diplodia corticola TaxID=236234 RepID=A0A1J9RKK5_9PEZI|nr:system protein b [Diplodia corticola]OJD29055.1 system protein b [Diplodia corticola]
MFAFGGSSSLLAGRHDSTKERPPPELPTPVKFPNFQPPVRKPAAWTKDGDPPALLQQFARIKKPSDITIDQFLGLNVSLEPETSIGDLLSVLPGVASYAVPQEWTELPADGAPVQAPAQQGEGPKRLLSNGRPFPGREDFAIRLKELVLDNHDAFSVLTRISHDKEKKPPRLAHYRKFWEGLDNMAYYWDTSLDEYIPPKPEDQPKQTDAADASETAEDRKTSDVVESEEATRLEATHIDESVARKKAKTAPTTSAETAPSSGTAAAAASDQSQPINLAQRPAPTPAKLDVTNPPRVPNGNSAASNNNKPAGMYKGLRIGTGSGMPDGYRIDTVRSFVEPVAWCFGMNIAPHRRPPALQMRNLRVPVRVTAAVWRSSTDRLKARQNFVHGPAAGLRVADYVDFGGGGGGGDGQQEALLDVMREVGSLLHIAQERAREGRTETKPGAGKWWTAVPRWGGGKGGEVGEARGEDSGEGAAPKPEKEERPIRSSRRPARKKTAAEVWAELKPGAGYWDPKVEYEAIGKDRSSEWDDVFTVSSVNTHIALLHLRVHPAYISWIETGELPSPLPADENWCRPVLRRTRWYDLFHTEDRIEATRGLWMLFGWLARPQEEPEKTNGVKEGEDVVMKDA